MSDKPKLVKMVFEQDADCCSDGDVQRLSVTIQDGGGGDYFLIKTQGWAFDNIAELTALLEQIRPNDDHF